MTRIHIVERGVISEKEREWVVHLLDECYNRMGSLSPPMVELNIYKSSSAMDASLNREKAALGVETGGADSTFLATHEAWRGIPRITVCIERMKAEPRIVAQAAVRHEAGHSAIHGSPEFYVLPLPIALLEASEIFPFFSRVSQVSSYLIFTAVKDYEVTRLLHMLGYIKDQAAFARRFSKPSEEDYLAAHLAGRTREATALLCASWLKNVSCLPPFLGDLGYSRRATRWLTEASGTLPRSLRPRLTGVVKNHFPQLQDDTFQNIQSLAQVFKEEILSEVWADTRSEKAEVGQGEARGSTEDQRS